MCLYLYACTRKDRHLWMHKRIYSQCHRDDWIKYIHMMENISVYCSRYSHCNIYTLTDLNIYFQNQQHLFTLNCNKNWRRHQLVLEFYLFNVQKQFLCLWCRLSSTTGKLHLSNCCIQSRGKGMTAWQHLSVGTLQGLAFWVLISKVSSHSKKQ